MIQLEVGKRYVRRDGVVTGPLRWFPGYAFTFADEKNNLSYMANGQYCWDDKHHADLVAEYSESRPSGYDHLGDLQREYNETQEREAKETACWEALSGMVVDNQAMGMYDPPQPAVRTFASGATRNLDHNKLDYEGFNCPAAQRAFAEYMHAHRKQTDGTMRAGDNWQKGIDVVEYMRSVKRHTQDLHLLHRGWSVTRPEDGIDLLPTTENKIELLCAIWFNVQGMIHELLKEERNANQSS